VLATPSATPMQRIRAVPAVSSGRCGALFSTPALGAVSSGSRHHLAKVRVAGSNPVVRSNVIAGQRPFGAAVLVSKRQHEGAGPRLGRGRFADGAPEPRVEGLGEFATRLGEQVPVAVGGDADRGVRETFCDEQEL